MENKKVIPISEEIEKKNKKIESAIKADFKKAETVQGRKELEKKIKKKASEEYGYVKEYNKNHQGLKQVFEQTDRLVIKNEKENLLEFKSYEQLRKEALATHQSWLTEFRSQNHKEIASSSPLRMKKSVHEGQSVNEKTRSLMGENEKEISATLNTSIAREKKNDDLNIKILGWSFVGFCIVLLFIFLFRKIKK